MSTVQEALPVRAVESPMAELPQPGRRIAAFDGMRAIAVLLVLVGHAGFEFHGFIGVDVFFVLSGYLITSILLDELGKTKQIGFKNFYMRRVLRLFPALLLLVTLNFIASMIFHKRLGLALGDSAIALTYISNWTLAFGDRPASLAHTWSLSIEEQFYLLWPVMVLGLYWLLGRTRKAAALCVMAAVAILFYRHWMDTRPLPSLDPHGKAALRRFSRIYFGLDTRGDDLLAGAALAFWMPQISRFLAAVVGWAGVLALVWYTLLIEADTPNGLHCYLWGLNIPMPAISAMGRHPYALVWLSTLAILVSILNDRKGLLARILSFKPLAWVGVISYGLYLFHFPIVTQLSEWKWNRWATVAAEVPLAFGVATISFYALERPCLRLKDRFRPAQTGARE